MRAVRTTGSDPAAGAKGLAERMHDFRSLGGNCEFGFVQRYCGAEPSGLFRFSFTPLDDLIHAIETDFETYGAPSDLHLVETENGYYYCASRCYRFWSNINRKVGEGDPGTLLEQEYGRVAHLKRRMLEDLSRASKILVRKVGADEDEADFARLARAVWRHGPSTLLRVTESPSEAVRWTSDRILQGGVRRFAPREQAWEVDLEPWIGLCDAAYAARHRLPAAALASSPPVDAMRWPERAGQHRGQRRKRSFRAFTRPVDPTLFEPGKPYVFSAWVWIPAEASVTRIFALMGPDRLGSGDADVTVRDRWQLVWAAGRIALEQTDPRVGLGMIGTRTDRFRSCGWRVHDGPIPDRSALPPDVNPPPSLFRWFTAWWP